MRAYPLQLQAAPPAGTLAGLRVEPERGLTRHVLAAEPRARVTQARPTPVVAASMAEAVAEARVPLRLAVPGVQVSWAVAAAVEVQTPRPAALAVCLQTEEMAARETSTARMLPLAFSPEAVAEDQRAGTVARAATESAGSQ